MRAHGEGQDRDQSVPPSLSSQVYSGVEYDGCTQQSTSGWCATAAYENSAAYYSYKYCTEEDWTTLTDTVAEEEAAALGSSG